MITIFQALCEHHPGIVLLSITGLTFLILMIDGKHITYESIRKMVLSILKVSGTCLLWLIGIIIGLLAMFAIGSFLSSLGVTCLLIVIIVLLILK
jgi:hypothetical protein